MTCTLSQMLALIAIGGLALAACGVYRATTGVRRHRRDPARSLALMRGFRLTVVGLCAAGVAAGWLWDLGWLIGLSLIIGGEEFLESTVMIAALSRQRAGRSEPATWQLPPMRLTMPDLFAGAPTLRPRR